MSDHRLYTQEVEAILPDTAWDEAYFSLLSLKHVLQGIPGWESMNVYATNLGQSRLRVTISTYWDTPINLETWLLSPVTVEGVLKALDPPPEELQVRFYEKLQ